MKNAKSASTTIAAVSTQIEQTWQTYACKKNQKSNYLRQRYFYGMDR